MTIRSLALGLWVAGPKRTPSTSVLSSDADKPGRWRQKILDQRELVGARAREDFGSLVLAESAH